MFLRNSVCAAWSFTLVCLTADMGTYKSQPLCNPPANCWRQLRYRPQKIASYWTLKSGVQRWHFKYQEAQNRHASTLHNWYVPGKACIR